MGRELEFRSSAPFKLGNNMKLVVEWSLCDGNGVCTLEAPELLMLSEQDELVVLSEKFGPELEAKARAAVRVCPKQALRINREQ
jgi:ferredoxin